MSYVFILLGWIGVLVGGIDVAWIFRTASLGSSVEIAAALLASLPGLSVIGSGLISWAIGLALSHLARIERHTGDMADALDAIVKQQAGGR